jgi:hypothetical protein
MASESDTSSFLTPSTDLSLPTRTRGITASQTWAHTRKGRTANGEDSSKNYCIHCENKVPPAVFATKVTTNMRNHLKAVHKIMVEATQSQLQRTVAEQLEQLYAQAERTDSTSEVDKQVFRKRLNNTTIDEALVSLIVVRNLPFRLVEWPEFHTFCQVLNPESYGTLHTAHSTIGMKIKDAYLTHKDTVRKRLQSALSCIHIFT